MSQKRDEFHNTMHSDPYPGGSQAQLFVRGLALDADRRSEFKAKLKAGELHELTFEAVVFRDGPNANHTRFRQSDLDAFAASFAGVPFLRNHDTGDIGSRDGTIVASMLVGSEIHQTVRLTTERGMLDFLEGVIDRFSIGWYFEGVECGLCGQDWFECSHWPGQKVEGKVCELLFVGPRGKETSAVNAPAVQGTRIIEQLCQMKSSAIGAELVKVSALGVEQGKESSMPGEENASVGSPQGVDGALKVVEPVATIAVVPQVGESPASSELLSEVRTLQAQIQAERVEQLIRNSGLSQESQDAVRLGAQGQGLEFVAQLIEAQRKVDAAHIDIQIVSGIRPIMTEGMMTTPHDRVQSALSWIFGVRDEPMPMPSMRSIRDLYQAITGDHNWYGVFSPEWSQLAAASTTTLSGMVVNALNKIVRMHYDNMATYRWYERIVDVAPHDGNPRCATHHG